MEESKYTEKQNKSNTDVTVSHKQDILDEVLGAACYLTDEINTDKQPINENKYDVYIVNNDGNVHGYELKQVSNIDKDSNASLESIYDKKGNYGDIIYSKYRSKNIPPHEYYGKKKTNENKNHINYERKETSKNVNVPIILEISDITNCEKYNPEKMSSDLKNNKAKDINDNNQSNDCVSSKCCKQSNDLVKSTENKKTQNEGYIIDKDQSNKKLVCSLDNCLDKNKVKDFICMDKVEEKCKSGSDSVQSTHTFNVRSDIEYFKLKNDISENEAEKLVDKKECCCDKTKSQNEGKNLNEKFNTEMSDFKENDIKNYIYDEDKNNINSLVGQQYSQPKHDLQKQEQEIDPIKSILIGQQVQQENDQQQQEIDPIKSILIGQQVQQENDQQQQEIDPIKSILIGQQAQQENDQQQQEIDPIKSILIGQQAQQENDQQVIDENELQKQLQQESQINPEIITASQLQNDNNSENQNDVEIIEDIINKVKNERVSESQSSLASNDFVLINPENENANVLPVEIYTRSEENTDVSDALTEENTDNMKNCICYIPNSIVDNGDQSFDKEKLEEFAGELNETLKNLYVEPIKQENLVCPKCKCKISKEKFKNTPLDIFINKENKVGNMENPINLKDDTKHRPGETVVTNHPIDEPIAIQLENFGNKGDINNKTVMTDLKEPEEMPNTIIFIEGDDNEASEELTKSISNIKKNKVGKLVSFYEKLAKKED